MRHPLALALLLLGLAALPAAALPARTTAGPAATIGAVRRSLLDAIERLQAAPGARSAQVQSAGDSLVANTRAVLEEVETRLAGRFEQGIDRLDATERRLVTSAEELATQLDSASSALAGLSAADAHRLLGDADILAHDTVHALPCRSQRPRVVYVTPEELHVGAEPAEIRIRGNYLAFGAEPEIRVEGQPALLIARRDHELHVQLPPALFRCLEAPRSVTVRFRPTARSRACYLWGLLPWSSLVAAEQELAVTVVLRPHTAGSGPG
ncbi:MAG: hypothetical protein M5U13_03125 [Thermoanaerobaculia bacterium]|nr:hypothetical protein [Thermoanaerobaculia bacterium]